MSRRRPLHTDDPSRGGEEKDGGSDLQTNGTPQSKPTEATKPSGVAVEVVIVFHLVMVVYYGWLIYHGTRLMADNKHILDPKGKMPAFGGRFKFLTHITQWVQLSFFSLQLLADLFPHRPSRKQLQRACDFLFTTVAFPLCFLVVVTFWGIYAIDRQLVYPEVFDKFVHPIINHSWHTAIALFVLVEMYLVAHRYPSTGAAAVMVFLYSTAYISWVVLVFVQTGFWVYPFLRLLQPAVMALFFAGSMFFALALHLLGRRISAHFWGSHHHSLLQ